MELIKIVFEFFSKDISAFRIRDITFTAVLLIQLVGHRESDLVLALELKVVLLNKVVENIGLQHHVLRCICIIVVLTKTTIHLKAVVCDLTKLITNLRHERLILARIDCLSRGRNVDQPSDKPRLRVSDLNRFVSTDKQYRIHTLGVALDTFLVDKNSLMCHGTVKKPIRLNT